MSTQTQFALQRLGQLFVVPMMNITFTIMWMATRLGFRRAVLELLGSQMQSRRIKQRAFQSYQPTKRDLFVCTYSKSGTNWMMQIAYQIAHHGHGDYEHIHDVVPWPDAPMPSIVTLDDDATYRGAPTGMRVIKTHLESEYVPYSPEAGYIVVVRDPKEIFVSSYFFSSGMFSDSVMVPVDEWHAMFLSDKFPYGSWSEHLASYWPWRSRDNVLFFTFAEMKQDLPGVVRRVAEFMDVALSEEELALVVEKSEFSYMKRIDHKFVPHRPRLFKNMGKTVMIRKGEHGKSSELLSHEQQAQIDRYMRAELRRHGCDFPYDETYVTVDCM
ncbi:MAG TPA: sulfotransferase domain-containing protein [Herpetosiphonaceae bacterium]